MTETSCTDSKTNGVSYMNDQLGLHRMENPSHVEGAVSLHLYVPPYSECQTFDQRTGVRSKATVTFYTKYGRKVDYRRNKKGKLAAQPIKEEPRTITRCPAEPVMGESSMALVEQS